MLHRTFVFIGDQGVGKTTFIKQFSSDKAINTQKREINTIRKFLCVHKDGLYIFDLIEPCDEPMMFEWNRYPINEATIVFFCFDLCNIQSFKNIERYHNNMSDILKNPIGVVLLGFKAEDILNYGQNSEIKQEMINDLIKKYKFDQYHTISCKEKHNLQKSMLEAVELAENIWDPYRNDHSLFRTIKKLCWFFGCIGFEY